MGKQAEYLRLQFEGGTRTPSSWAITVPTSNVKLNKYGNLIGGQGRIKRLLNRKDTFQGTRSAALLASGSGLDEDGAAVSAEGP